VSYDVATREPGMYPARADDQSILRPCCSQIANLAHGLGDLQAFGNVQRDDRQTDQRTHDESEAKITEVNRARNGHQTDKHGAQRGDDCCQIACLLAHVKSLSLTRGPSKKIPSVFRQSWLSMAALK